MSGWPILDVAIGLAFVYLLLSTICSSLAEGIESQLRSRSKYLERGIATIFGDSTEAVKHFFVHPVIASFINHEGDNWIRKLFRMITDKVAGKKIRDHADQRPAYLPGDKFALVALEMVQRMDEAGKPLYPELAKTLESILSGITMREDQIKALNVWYDQVMQRVSGWYKRHAQAWIRFLAVMVVVVLNADTLQITSILWTDPAVRQQAVEQATARVQQAPPEPVHIDYTDTDETAAEEQPAEVGTAGDSSDKHYGVTTEQRQFLNQVGNWDADRKVLNDNLEAWDASHAGNPNAGSRRGIYLSWVGYLLRRHFLGWFLTMVAVSLGAPFWFGALNRLVNIRNVGNAPAKKDDAAAA
jgi:hypothetical protein